MFRRISDFESSWAYEREATIKIMKALTPASLDQKIDAKGRTLGRLAWHVTETVPEMLNKAGLAISEMPESEHSSDPSKIVQEYSRVSQEALEAIKKNWSDDSLETTHEMYGNQWARGTILNILISHQIHHRAQMTVLMRQASLAIPGMYGPSREEWAEMNMPALA